MALGRTNGVGAGGLNYRVKAYAEAPTAPGKVNDIAIVTSTAIGDIQINCASAPTLRSDGTALQAGDVYIAALTTTSVPFNALKKNALFGLPGTCFQYDGSEWNSMDAWIYTASGWVRFSSSFGLDAFSYSGTEGVDYIKIDDGDGNWRMKLLTSGTLTVQSQGIIDVFLVAGGASGSFWTSTIGAAGGGGYTATHSGVSIQPITYPIVVGAGGIRPSGASGCVAGGATSAFGFSVLGGTAGAAAHTPSNGGSGGAAVIANAETPGLYGGTDGANGVNSADHAGGSGQGTTTREFGEASGTLYSDGGSGSNTPGPGNGGGAGIPSQGNVNGATNTGSGGGSMGSGGSGIVIVRNARAVA